MGFFDFLKKAEKEIPIKRTPVEIKLSDSLSWFQDNFNEDVKNSSEKAIQICSEIMANFQEIQNNLSELEKAEFNKEDKTYVRVNMTKDSFVKKATVITYGLDRNLPDPDYQSIFNFYERAKKSLDALNTISLKEAVLLSNYFKEKGSPLINSIKKAKEKADSLDYFLKNEGKALLLLFKIVQKHNDFSASDDRKRQIIGMLKNIKERINELKQSSDQIRARVKDVQESPEYQEYIKSKEDEDSFSVKIFEIEKEVNLKLSVLERPLKKARHLSNQGKIGGLPVSRLSENPFRELVLTNSENSIQNTINTIKEAQISGIISLKDSEIERLETVSSYLGDVLIDRKKKYENLQKHLVEALKKKEQSSFSLEKKKELEEKLKRKEVEIERLEMEVAILQKELRWINENLTKKAKELSEIITQNSHFDATVTYNQIYS